MKDSCVVLETWTHRCALCHAEWKHTYEAWHVDNGCGRSAVTWRDRGHLVPAPWSDPACPACSGPACPAPECQAPAGAAIAR
ncbi:hypothetical protein [Nonomuraea roseola]|uniref:Zinc-ribbon domain-containing protein n=1 Tax=Nonomuraea roseola TaxID=46179 RepID=A0ABV5PZL0_9ACTN